MTAKLQLFFIRYQLTIDCFYICLQRGSVELFLQMPKEAKESFEDSLKIVKQIITEKKSQIAADSEGKLVGRLLPEVQG